MTYPLEWTFGLIDNCSVCNGLPTYSKIKQGYIIECGDCGQCIGPSKDRNELGWSWNKEQRGVDNGRRK